MRIVYLFDLRVELDARAQKEIAAFAKNGHQITVFEWNKDRNYSIRPRALVLRRMEIPCVSLGVRVKKGTGIRQNIGKLFKFERKLFFWLLRNHKQFDLFYCVNLDTAYICSLVAKLTRKPFIYDAFDDYADAHQCGPSLRSKIKKLDYRVMRKAKKVILCSEKRKQQVIAPLDNCVIINNVPDITLPAKDRGARPFVVVYVGNLMEGRMIEDLLVIVADHPEWRLECGGEGVLKELVQQYALQYDNIRYHGVLPYERVIRLEQEGDVVPALYDPQVPNHVFAAPNKVFEAMSIGKPTIMVRNTGMDGLVEREKTGLVISCDRASLEAALVSICDHLEYWESEAPRLRNLFRERYSWDQMEQRLMQTLSGSMGTGTLDPLGHKG